LVFYVTKKVSYHHVKHTLFVIKIWNNVNEYCYSYWLFCYKKTYSDIMLYIVMFHNTQGRSLIINIIINFYHINFNVHSYLIKPKKLKKLKKLIRCSSHDNQSKLKFNMILQSNVPFLYSNCKCTLLYHILEC
jgi:hypothetical protein